tara:strand:- start:250 stop:429 length:180 start_codon:yes stop_codon:yes gene_type:complete
MNYYEIVFRHKDTSEMKIENVKKICFAEAAQEAYLFRSKLGYSWEITSINQKEGKVCQN